MLTYNIRSNAAASHLHAVMQEGFGHGWDVNPVEGSDARLVIKAVPFGQMKLSLASLPQAEISNVARPSSGTPDHPYNIYVSNRRHRVVTNNHSVIL